MTKTKTKATGRNGHNVNSLKKDSMRIAENSERKFF